MSFPSFESAGAGAGGGAGDVVGQLPHLLVLFSPSAVEVQGLVGNGARAPLTTTAGSNDHNSLDPAGYAQGPGPDHPALVLARPWFTDPLHEPHLSWVVSEIGVLPLPPPLYRLPSTVYPHHHLIPLFCDTPYQHMSATRHTTSANINTLQYSPYHIRLHILTHPFPGIVIVIVADGDSDIA